ncbi:TRAP transporter substrate-binding protein [Elioraea sp.]|jgi:tripartite ATP-independent transporter DctP family solute receptor|uniref:TRAP transporter substrate-binding protein n=1 Tax=Elioraea sp. TaxID=2185103 RepID=UPI0021DDB2E6|nr:TRAP transporter substrate-binding protein [Elioraea sp.]GIX10215.1 MAG: TRAP ABC transporter substrate-binding protein [Elioraea sp.]
MTPTRRTVLGAAGAAATLPWLSRAARAATLRYAHVGAPGDVQTRFAEEFAALARQKSGGRTDIRVFGNSQLGGVSEMVDGVQTGAIQMAHHDFAALTKYVPELGVFNAPYVYRDGRHALAATDPERSPVARELNERLVAAAGIRIVGRIYRGPRHITAKFAVRRPEDLSNKPFRAVPVDLWVSMVRGFGAVPTPVEVSELPTALMTGVVVGQENPLTMINANKLFEVQSHVSLTGHMLSVLAVFANDRAWQRLPADEREAISAALAEKAVESLAWAEAADAELVQVLKQRGMTVITEADGLDNAAFRRAVQAQIRRDYPAWTPLIERIGQVQAGS